MIGLNKSFLDKLLIYMQSKLSKSNLPFTSEGRHKTGVEFQSFFGPETIELIKCFLKENSTPEAEDPLFPGEWHGYPEVFRGESRKTLGTL